MPLQPTPVSTDLPSTQPPTHPLRVLAEVIGGLATPGRAYALLDYPLYNNPGDAAIWVGARRMLASTLGRPPAYASVLGAFDAAACRRAIGDGVVFILGGGNFGSLYPKHHAQKLAVIDAMAGNRIVHLPLSLAGVTPGMVTDTCAAMDRHGDVTLIAREWRSRDALARQFGLTVPMAPDTAHAIALQSPVPDRAETVLWRRDREGTGSAERSGWDWPDIPQLRLLNRLGKLGHALTRGDLRLSVMDRLAEARVEIACGRLGRGERIVTNRLHAMILGALLGRKVIARDNSTGKLSAYADTWGHLLGQVELVP